MEEIYEVRITSGTSRGPYSVFLNMENGPIASKTDNILAQHIPYDQFIDTNYVSVRVPSGTTALFLYNELCKTSVSIILDVPPPPCTFTFKAVTEDECSFDPIIIENIATCNFEFELVEEPCNFKLIMTAVPSTRVYAIHTRA